VASTTLPGSEQDLSDEQREILQLVRDRYESADRLHRQYRSRWDEEYGLYRNYRQLRDSVRANVENDRDVLITEQREWGANLFIPKVYTAIETVLPRLLSNNPKMLILPNVPEAKDAVEPMQRRYEYDQNRINYELRLQDTAKRGLIYGLGVQKTYWHKCYRSTREMLPSVEDANTYVPQKRGRKLMWESPYAEAVDIYDFFWDPSAKDIESARYVIHRLWRDYDYVCQKVENGDWDKIDLEQVKGQGSATNRAQVISGRMEAAGMSNFDIREGDQHEIWEYHDGDRVITVLNNNLIVQDKPNPFNHGEIPFQLYRPNRMDGEFAGISEVEAVKHLQYELNTLRSQRRDAATFALNPPLFAQEGALENNDLITGPGVYQEVWGDPKEVLWRPQLGDIPGSGYQEEDAILRDFDQTTGINDAVTGAESQPETTATGYQLRQANANERIKLKAKNLMVETVRGAACQWRYLYQQFGKTETIRVTDQNAPEGYDFQKVTPEHYNADWDVLPEAGSTLSESIPERRQGAIQRYQALQTNPDIDQRKNSLELLRDLDVREPESWLKPEQPEQAEVDPIQLVGQTLKNLGIPEQDVMKAMEAAMQESVPPPEEQAEGQPGQPEMNGAPPQEAPVG
jgi:hypothetical protein